MPKDTGAGVIPAPLTREVDADAVEKYWQIGLAAHTNDPDTATDAISAIFNAMFPGNLPLLARIVGALYGDHYFVDTQFSADLLAQELNATLGINPPDCQAAAASAFQQWCGLSVRANFGDGGTIPRPGNIYASPDTFVNGTVATPPATLIRMWGQSVWGPVNGLTNLAYGRAASINFGVPITKPVMKMFITDAGLNNSPNQWTQLFTQGEEATATPLVNQQWTTGPSTLNPGDRSANADPFVWTPQGTGHYCLIAVAGSEFFANDPTLVPPGNWNSSTWILNNGAAGWHNLDVLQKDEATLKIYNLDSRTEQFTIEAHCSRVPKGTEVSLESGDAQLASAFRTGAVKIVSGQQVVRVGAQLPPSYKGDLVIRVATPDGKPLPAPASVEVRMYWELAPGHPNYSDAVRAVGDTEAIALSRPVRLFTGAFTFVGQ